MQIKKFVIWHPTHNHNNGYINLEAKLLLICQNTYASPAPNVTSSTSRPAFRKSLPTFQESNLKVGPFFMTKPSFPIKHKIKQLEAERITAQIKLTERTLLYNSGKINCFASTHSRHMLP